MFMIDHAAKRPGAYPTVIVIDEISLCGQRTVQWFKKHYPYAKLYCLGDELQL